jgi:CRP-like cAMP-binding protein
MDMTSAPPGSPEHQRLIRKLDAIAALSDEDREAVAGLPLRLGELAENTVAVSEGDAPDDCCLLVEGLMCRYKILGAGQRQIFAFHIPGDIPDLPLLEMEAMDHSIGTITPCRVAYIPREALRELAQERPRMHPRFGETPSSTRRCSVNG